MTDEVKALYEERKSLFDKAIHYEHTYRVPTAVNGGSWFPLNYGKNLVEASDPETRRELNRKKQEEYCFDAGQVDGGSRYDYYQFKAIKNAAYILKEDALLYVDRVMVHDEDLVKAAKDQTMYAWTVVGPEYYGMLTYKDARDYLRAFGADAALTAQLEQMMVEDYGTCFHINTSVGFMVPIEYYFYTRGLKKFGIDMRRRKAELQEAIEIMEPGTLAQFEAALAADKKEGMVFDSLTSLLIHTIMNNKQFEELYLPSLKKLTALLEKYDKNTLLYFEGECLRLADYFKDFPKPRYSIFPEVGDAVEIRKAFPGMPFVGGYPMEYLREAEAAECVDKAKELIDKMGDGFIFSTSKMLTYKNDARPENLKAVQKFVLDYRV